MNARGGVTSAREATGSTRTLRCDRGARCGVAGVRGRLRGAPRLPLGGRARTREGAAGHASTARL